MAKIGEIIRFVDDIKPNAFTDAQKLQWLNELEGKIQVLILCSPAEELRPAYVLPGDADTQALVPKPYDKLYWMYLGAMIDFGNGEYSKYQNSMILFNDAYEDYAKAYLREHRPEGNGGYAGVW